MTMKANIGFEWGNILEDPNFSISNATYVLPSTAQKRQGGYALKVTAGNPASWYYWAQLNCTAASELFLQFAIYIEGTPATALECFAWRKGTTTLGGFKINFANSVLEVYTGNFVTKIGEVPFTLAAFQVYEIRIQIGDAGIIQVRRDMGALAVDFAGDTQPGADTTIDNFRWGNWGNTAAHTYLDDIILNDTVATDQIDSRTYSWPGGLRIIRQAVTGDGATLQFTPTPGPTHSTAVDEVPPVATDKLVSDTAGQVDELVLADCPGDVQTIIAVQPMAFGVKGSSNPPTRLALGLKIDAVDYYSGDLDLAVSQAVAKELWVESPANPGNPLTVSEINGATLLLKSAA